MYRYCAFVWMLPIVWAMSIDTESSEFFRGNTCTLHTSQPGTCKSFHECNWVVDMLKKGAIKHHQIVNCGFEGDNVIICCGDPNTNSNNIAEDRVVTPPTDAIPLNVPVSSGGSGKKIIDACQDFRKYATRYTTDYIIQGTAADLREYPHMAAIGYPNDENTIEYNCGGTLISDQWIVTAAHCVGKRKPPTTVRMGNVYLDGNDDVDPVDRDIIESIRHPQYSAEFIRNDIALLKLKEPVPFNEYVRPACIRTERADVPIDTELIIAGWGSLFANVHKRPAVMQKANVTVDPLESCNATLLKYNEKANQPSLRNGLLDSQMCTIDEKSDACQGDSGGPVFTSETQTGVHTIIGVVSFGISCGTHLPSVYTRLASYNDWIENHVWPK